MIVRQAQPEPPLPCYGLEYEAADHRCQVCPHQTGCVKSLGKLAGRIRLSEATYSLLPPAFQDHRSRLEGIPSTSLDGFFQEAHQLVYGRPSKRGVYPHERRVQKDAEECGLTPFVYLATLLLSHQQTSGGQPFCSSALHHADTVTRVNLLKQAARHKFGGYDLKALAGTVDSGLLDGSLRHGMLQDEVRAGQFIVDYKIINGGGAFLALFEAHEREFSQDWLAIEPAYAKFITNQPEASPEVLLHRKSVWLRHGAMKRHKPVAMAAFQAREAVAATAVRQVLRQFSVDPRDLLISPAPVSSMLPLWAHLGTCLQILECLRALDGQPNRYGIKIT